ncbi:MAG: hypothetical protein ACE5E6_03745 [Phycisphaerae bacterium]
MTHGPPGRTPPAQRRRGAVRCGCALSLTWPLWFALYVSAQPDERIEPGVLHLGSVDGFVEFESTVEQIRVRSRNGAGRVNARQNNRHALTEGVVGLRFSGDVVHPYLIDFSGSVALGFSEGRFREGTLRGTDTDRATGFLHEFDVRANLFKTKPITGSVYGLRREERIGRIFLPSLRETRSGFGTVWTYAHATHPLNVSFDHSRTDRTGNRSRIDNERIEEDRLRVDWTWRMSEHHDVQVAYEHLRLQQAYQGSNLSFDTRRNQLRIEHELGFGPDHRHRFQTLLRVQEESGDLAEDVFEFRPELVLQHTENVSTRYAYTFRHESVDGFDVDVHRADIQLRHQFLKNLTTVVDVFGLQERADDGVDTTQGGGSVDWHYTRGNPLGRLTAELGLAFDSEQTRGNNGLRAARNESGTFRDPLPVYLVNRDVVPVTLVVTDVTGRIVYRMGTDYTLFRVRDRIALLRLANGRIVNGQTVLIDYRYRTPLGGRIDTQRVDFSIQQDFTSGLTPYYRFNYRDQDVDRSTGFALSADRTDHHRLGFTYHEPKWSLHGEYEVFDDTVEPYDAFHFGGAVQAVRDDRQTLDVSADFSQYFFEGGFDARDVSELNLRVDHDYRINERWTSGVRSAYRWEDDSRRGITQGFDLEGTLEYRRGNLMVELSLEYDVLRIDDAKEDGVAAWVRVHWDIVDLLEKG